MLGGGRLVSKVVMGLGRLQIYSGLLDILDVRFSSCCRVISFVG